VTEPCYSWNNINELGHQVGFSSAHGPRANVHYFNNTPMPGYTPYTYPHPLTKGLSPPEQTTQNATANSQDDGHRKRRPWGGKTWKENKQKRPKKSPTSKMPEGQGNADKLK